VQTTWTAREVTIGDHAYRYLESGSGTPLVLFHGWSGSAENFTQWLPTLAPRFRVIVPDLPGCAGAPPLAQKHTVAAYAAFAHDFVDALGLAPCVVGGLCSGASIAMSLAAAHPEDATALVLHTPFFHPSVIRPTMRTQLALLGTPAGALYDALRRNTLLANTYRRFTDGGTGVATEEEERNRRNLAVADPRAARELAVDLSRLDHRALLRSWTKPVDVIVADADAFVLIEPFATQLREVAPNARLTVIAGGHGWTPVYIAAQSAALRRFADAFVVP
jgi:pimeloyl-ACP methyl ester carboxylesterase